jgi:4-amino-4-deoxy-L-arabinose transferase-like glycosyltransferase
MIKISNLDELKKGRACALIFLFWALLYLPRLSEPELDYDEGRRVFPAITMLQTGGWAVPEFEGEKYFRKPPLMNWLIASSFKTTGITNEFTARLPSALSVLALSMFLILSPSNFLPGAKVLSSLMILTTIGLLVKCRTAEIDGIYAVFGGLAAILWLNLYSLKRAGFALWFFPALILGLSLLLKGPMALIFFYICAGSVLICRNKTKMFLSPSHIISFALIFLIFLSWYYFASSSSPNGESAKISGTWSSEIIYRLNPKNIVFSKWIRNVMGALLACLPWILFLPLARKSSRTDPSNANNDLTLPLLRALIVFFLITALMPATKPRYFMPAHPIIAVLAAVNIANFANDKALKAWAWTLKISAALLFAASIICLCVYSGTSALLKISPRFENIIPSPVKSVVFSFSPYDVFMMALGFLAALLCLLFIQKHIHRDCAARNSQKLAFLSCLCVLAFAIFADAYAVPFGRLKEKDRPAAKIINRSFDSSFHELKLFNVGLGEPFLFYLNMPYRAVGKDELLKGKGIFLLPSETYGGLVKNGEIDNNSVRALSSFKRKKMEYSIIVNMQ